MFPSLWTVGDHEDAGGEAKGSRSGVLRTQKEAAGKWNVRVRARPLYRGEIPVSGEFAFAGFPCCR